MILVAVALGAVVLALGTAVTITGLRRRQARVVTLGLVGVVLGALVAVPAVVALVAER